MYDQIAEHSPGAASINEAIRLERARQQAHIGRTLSARLAAIGRFEQEGGTVTVEQRMAVRAQIASQAG